MLKLGDIVRIDPNYDHPDVRRLKADDPEIFEVEGEVLYIDSVYVEVGWDDNDGTSTYPSEWLINIREFRPEPGNPNNAFKSQKFKLKIDEAVRSLTNFEKIVKGSTSVTERLGDFLESID